MIPSTIFGRRLAVTALCLAPLAAASQSFPARPLRIVVATTQGTSVDLFPRMLAPRLSEGFGQSVVVENRPGGSGIPGTEHVIRSAPDGYTILHGTTSNVISVPLSLKKPPYDPYKDLAPIAAAIDLAAFVIVRASLPVGSMKELVEHAKRAPGKLSYGSGGAGAYHHIVGEAMQMATGMRLLHVPYKSVAQAGVEVMADRIDMTFGTLAGVRPFVASGKAKIITFLGKSRYPGMPNLPGLGEEYPAFEKPPAWFAFWGPGALPRPIVTRWHSEIGKAMASPEARSWFEINGAIPYDGTPERLTQMTKEGAVVYRRMFDAVGVKPE